jgi:integrase
MAQGPATVPQPVASGLTVAAVLDKFLAWCQKHRAPRTYDGHLWHLQRFIDHLPEAVRLAADDLRPHHVAAWVDAHPDWGCTYRRNAITSVQRAFLWAEKLGYIARSPVRNVEKPMPDRREQVITPEEFRRLLAAVKGSHFHDLLEFCWETGVRSHKAKVIEARHFNPARGRLEIPPKEAKGRNRWRVVYLTPRAAEIVTRLAGTHPEGPILRNRSGRPWTTFAVNCRFCRLQGKLGTKYALGALRHSFCQRLLERGVDHVTVAALLGHKDAAMVSRVYAHMNQADGHLRRALSGD